MLVRTAPVGASYVDFGSVNILIALGIATIKATVVALMFMHLRWDHKFHAIIFSFSLIFLAIFIAFTMYDTETRGRTDMTQADRSANVKAPFKGVAIDGKRRSARTVRPVPDKASAAPARRPALAANTSPSPFPNTSAAPRREGTSRPPPSSGETDLANFASRTRVWSFTRPPSSIPADLDGVTRSMTKKPPRSGPPRRGRRRRPARARSAAVSGPSRRDGRPAVIFAPSRGPPPLAAVGEKRERATRPVGVEKPATAARAGGSTSAEPGGSTRRSCRRSPIHTCSDDSTGSLAATEASATQLPHPRRLGRWPRQRAVACGDTAAASVD